MQSRSNYFIFIVIGLAILSGYLYTLKPYQKGLDVSGGTRLIYQMDTSKLTADQKTHQAGILANIVNVMQSRAGGSLGVQEPTVIPKGFDQVIVELPGFTNEDQAKEAMGSSARIELYWARNVVTDKFPGRPYVPLDSNTTPIQFQRNSPGSKGEPLSPINPEYKNMISGWQLILSGDDLSSAMVEPAGAGVQVSLRFSNKGAEKMGRWSQTHFDQMENIAFVLDGQVLSIAHVQKGALLREAAQLTGNFPAAYANKLVKLLNSGSIPVDLKLLGSQTISPTIGQTALAKMVTAGIVSFGIISLFLIAYYAFPGLVAFLALMLYTLFTLTVLKLMNATFSLAAIAGFILSVGMAVDANILVFERFKEEMKSGRSLKTAIELGFRRALPAIIDSNACTILTSLVLLSFGTGPVKGFATTLIIGVAISLFTAVTVTRSLLLFFVNTGIGNNPSWYAVKRNWFGEKLEEIADKNPLKIVETSKKWFIISAIPIIPGLIFMGMGGLKGNVEFTGGHEAAILMKNSTLTSVQIAQNLEKAGFKGANVKFGEDKNLGKIAYLTIAPTKELNDEKNAKQKIAGAAGLSAENVMEYSSVGPSVSGETKSNAILGVVFSSALIVIYLALRFGIALGGFAIGLRFGFSAIGALLHDVLFVVSVAAIVGFFLGWEISALFITAMLTIIGFSVHDTIVIFDRARENLRKPLPGEDFAHLMNRSITQSFARSINTSSTVIVTLAIILFAGTTTPELKFFILTMLVGILSGTYSSIYNASPILYLWDKAVQKKKGQEFTIVGFAQNEAARTRVVATSVENAPQVESPDGRSYGQVRRRANPKNQATHEIDDL